MLLWPVTLQPLQANIARGFRFCIRVGHYRHLFNMYSPWRVSPYRMKCDSSCSLGQSLYSLLKQPLRDSLFFQMHEGLCDALVMKNTCHTVIIASHGNEGVKFCLTKQKKAFLGILSKAGSKYFWERSKRVDSHVL